MMLRLHNLSRCLLVGVLMGNLCMMGSAQVIDTFADGDFTQNPAWTGSVSTFTIASEQLRLQDTQAGSSYLSTSTSLSSIDNMEWRIWVRLSFSPSGNNYGRIYLVSDQSDLSSSLNGYYLQLGESGSEDAIGLYRQEGKSVSLLCKGVAGRIASSFSLHIKVTRTSSNKWGLWTKDDDNDSYTLEGECTDGTFTSSSYFGVFCTYTQSYSSSFYFDNVYIGKEKTPGDDLTPPSVTQVEALSATQVRVSFSELIDSTSAVQTTHYGILQNSPSNVIFGDDSTHVKLIFPALSNGHNYTLAVEGVQDLARNVMTSSSHRFLYFEPASPQSKDVIIHEIMADPTPAVGLPEVEYIELYNRSRSAFDLDDLTLSDARKTVSLPSFVFLPNTYLLLVSVSQVSKFSSLQNVVGVTGFPSLNNTNESLVVKTGSSSTLIDSVFYTFDWYHDDDKKDGGWSLELIDPSNLCAEAGNWKATENETGGTPGQVNSVKGHNPDLTGPELKTVMALSPDTLTLVFNEKLEIDISSFSFTLSPSIKIVRAFFSDLSLRLVKLVLQPPLTTKVLYTLNVADVKDCSGNTSRPSSHSIALTEPAIKQDVVISEILFNPKSGGVDFIEIYNLSNKYLYFHQWSLGHDLNEMPAGRKYINAPNRIFPPRSFLVLTSDAHTFLNYHTTVDSSVVVETSLPSLPDDEGSIYIFSEQQVPLDGVYYSYTFHSPFLKNKEGVSLERISYTDPSSSPTNWTSSSDQVYFSTPGKFNSAARSSLSTQAGSIQVEPAVISPQIPGQNFTRILYHVTQSGSIASVRIIDTQGRIIKMVAENDPIGASGFFRWDGDRDDGSQASSGYYLVYTEITDRHGRISVFRNRIVIWTR